MKPKHLLASVITILVAGCISKSFSQSISRVTYYHKSVNMNTALIHETVPTPKSDSNKLPGYAVFGTIDFGFSNLGLYGRSDIYLRQNKEFVKVGYSKSHTCILGDNSGEHCHGEKSSENHVTVQTFSVSMGIISRRCIFLSGGIAYSRFLYEHTQPMYDIISAQSVWATAINKSWGENVLNFRSANAVGIPLEAKWMINPSGFVDFNVGAMVYLNTEQTVYAVQIGLRLGRTGFKKSLD